MSHWIKELIAFIGEHGAWAYVAAFIVALLEAVPLIGSVVPGATVIIALSALVPATLSWTPMLVAVAAGAAIGDGASFWLGHKKKRAILDVWPLNRYPALIQRSEVFFQRYGILAVTIGRFLSPVRAFVPVTAGALGMPPSRFFPASILTAMIWACSHVATGAVGADLAQRYGVSLKHHGTEIVLTLTAVVVVSLLIRYLWRKRTVRPA